MADELDMQEIKLSSGASFTAESGVSILDAGTLARVYLPYSCKIGRCGACKCKVSSGSTNVLYPESGLDEREKAEGWILSCVRSAETDLALEVDDLCEIELPPVKMLPCRISGIVRLAHDVIQVNLRLPPTAEFRFIPGQYIEVIGPNGIRRSYSMANSCFEGKVLELHIRAVEGGAMSQYWFNQAKQNDLLHLNGPFGTFFLRDTANIDLIFLATGTGIAPIKAILGSMIAMPSNQYPKSVTVLWGGRTPKDLYWDTSTISLKHTFVPVLSRSDNNWTRAKGYVQDVLLDLNPDLNNSTVYACGSDLMINSARVRLIGAGLSPKRFYSDAFVCSAYN